MPKLTRRDALTGVGVALLTGCGGGSSPTPSPSPSPSPSPAPTSTPTPAPTPPVGSFGTLGATSAVTYTTLGHSIRGAGMGWDFVPVASSLNLQPQFTFRFVPPGSLVLAVPGIGEGTLVPNGSGGFTNTGQRTGAGFNVLGGTLGAYVVSAGGQFLSHIMQGSFTSAPEPGRPDPFLIVDFAYGLPVAASTLPTTGTTVFVHSAGTGRTLTVDHAARTVTGTMELGAGSGLKIYELTGVTLSPDRTRFAGRLVPADGSPEAQIEGIFMGPGGIEIAMRVVFPVQAVLYPFLIYARRNT